MTPAGRHAELTCAELEQWQQRGATVVDVREPYELLNGVIPGAVSLPISQFLQRQDELGQGSLVFVCTSGARSRSVAEYLVQHDHPGQVANLADGMNEWRAEGRPVASWRPPGA